MESLTDSALLAKLESSTSTPLFSLFSTHLHPFADLSRSNKRQTLTLIRSLAKQFLPFLNRCLSILPKRLSDPSKLLPEDDDLARQLFDIYRLCLDCVEIVSSELSCKPAAVYVQRLRLVCCLEAQGSYAEAVEEGFRVLEKVRVSDLGGKNGKSEREFVPGLVEDVDAELVKLVVEVVVVIVKCVALGKSMDVQDYRKVNALVDEAQPWFRVLDASTYEKLHRVLVTYLGKCTLFLAGELLNFDGDIARAFFMTTLNQYVNSSMKDQIYKFARRICSSLFLLKGDISSAVIDMVICILDSLANQCKGEVEKFGTEFVEIVSYCANRCQTASTIFCGTVAEYLSQLAGDFYQVMAPLDLILELYATGLSFMDFVIKSQGCITKDDPSVSILLHGGFRVCNLEHLLGLLQNYFRFGGKEKCVSCGLVFKDSANQICSELDLCNGKLLTSRQKNRNVYMLAHLNALKFLCQPLADLVNSEKKLILSENDGSSVSSLLVIILEALQQFCNVFLLVQSTTSERERDVLDERKMIVSVSVAAFILSIKTKFRLENIVHLIKHVIASEWIQPQELKHLFASLHNVGILLYRNKRMDEASEALKLGCRASWTRVRFLCQIFRQEGNQFTGDLTEDTILDSVNETCTRTAFLLDVLHQCGSLKMKKLIVRSLENWTLAEDLFSKMPGPLPLVKQWVKITCKLNKNMDVDSSAATLFNLLSSSVRVSKRAIGKILQQELLAYEAMDAMNPELCQRMQIKIVDILLHDVYVTEDSSLNKSRILLRKGWLLRAHGFAGLQDCIQCLSEAISTINGENCSSASSIRHQLAVVYSIRAFCIQEADPHSKQIFQDIKDALNLWLNIPISDYSFACEEGSMFSDTALLLLYNIIDLLSMKGSMEFHQNIYGLMFRLFNWKNVPFEKFLCIMWEGRRLSHAHCVSPVNDEFESILPRDFGEQFKSIDAWIRCLKGSPPLLLGFQQNFSHFFASVPCGSDKCATHQLDTTVDDVKDVASELISSVSVTSRSAFLAGYLYYNLCERLVANGQLFKALSYAKEAHRLRTKLFQETFMYSVEKRVEKHTEAWDNVQKLTYSLRNLQLNKSIASEVWSCNTTSLDGEACYLSPWKVLECYLESTLQVATIHEMIGNGDEAEAFLLWGKEISCSQSFPQFIVAFSTVLGKLYRKKHAWDLSEKAIDSAKQILIQSCTAFSCSKCKLLLEVNVDQQLADLSRSCQLSAAGSISVEQLSHAESSYRAALDKLNLPLWRNSVSYPNEFEDGAGNAFAISATAEPDIRESVSVRVGPNEIIGPKKYRKTKMATRSSLKQQSSAAEHNTRVTRSRYRSTQNQNGNISTGVEISLSNNLKDMDVRDLHDADSQRACGLSSEITCICKKMKCWFCLTMEVKESGLLCNFIHMKWEFVRRQLLLQVLNGSGKLLEVHGQIQEMHENIVQRISVLVSRNPFAHSHASVPLTLLLDLVVKDFSGDVFAIERATVLYSISWFCLKSYHLRDTGAICCDLLNVPLSNIVSWLMLAFVLCREIPMLFQKVSKLLSLVFIFSSSSELLMLPSYSKSLSESHWAAYFHQASIGTHVNYQFFSKLFGKHKAQQIMDDQGSHSTGPTLAEAETCNLLRLAPDSPKDLEHLVTDFFLDFPCTTVICISMIGGSFANLLQELLLYPSPVHAWMLLSRFNYKSQPIVMLLPVDSILEEVSDDDDDELSCGKFFERNAIGKHWHCPWGFTVVDDVAPTFKHILEENYLSSSTIPVEDTKENRTLWWMQRKKLNCKLGNLLRKLEDTWFGSWRSVLLGELSNCTHLHSIQKKLARNLKSKCKLDVNESLLKFILGGVKYSLGGEACISQLLSLKKGCFIGKTGLSDEESCETLSKESGVGKMSSLAAQLLQEAVNELEKDDPVNREPVILVLDYDVQMLPWENLPILRNQEVYRMPSVGSICLTLDRSCHHQEQVGSIAGVFPSIDPLDAFYLLNPSGDLCSTQVEFESWFRDQNLEGKAGSPPTTEELALALKSHDLFLYFGHGSGVQYISGTEIQKLENCAATLLMGCSSGALLLNGCYIPQGAPLSYLLAGSPVIVANLWEVTDKDIDRFGKAMLDAWLKERSNATTGCSECTLVAKEFEALNIRGGKGTKKKALKKVPDARDGGSLKECCDHRPKIASFMGQAREACTLPFLIGASPVCYGVPTGIRRKMDL